MRVLSFRRMPQPSRRRRGESARWWTQPDPPWWVKLCVGGVLYTGYLMVDSNRFDADEIRHLLVGLLLGGLGLRK